jgi:Family of unknown function (DUF5681)
VRGEPKKKLAPNQRTKSGRKYKRHQLKYAPRGKPFPLGHTFGLATRFQKGNRANPGGRPSFEEGHKAARAWLAAVVPGDPYKRTGAEMFVEVLGALGLSGDRAAIKEMLDRAEGTPPQSIHLSESQDNILKLCNIMTAKSDELGPPEGFIPRAPELEEGAEVSSDEAEASAD